MVQVLAGLRDVDTYTQMTPGRRRGRGSVELSRGPLRARASLDMIHEGLGQGGSYDGGQMQHSLSSSLFASTGLDVPMSPGAQRLAYGSRQIPGEEMVDKDVQWQQFTQY